MNELDRVPAILADIARFAKSAARVTARGHDRFVDPEDDDQRRIARSIVVDLASAAERLPEEFRASYPTIDWRGVRAVRNFIAHDYDGTEEEILWQAIASACPRSSRRLASEADSTRPGPVVPEILGGNTLATTVRHPT